MTSSSEDRPHSIWARVYSRIADRMDKDGATAYRAELVAGLVGSVLEVGCGPGRNFPHYPPEASVKAVEPEPYLRQQALQRARDASASIQVIPGRTEQLPYDDATFDAVVFSLVLCTVDPAPALVEMHRVLKPGGQLRYWEHVRSTHRLLGAIQSGLDRIIWPRIGAGCHVARDPTTPIEHAGFTIVEQRRFWFAPALLFPVGPQLLGRAERS